MMLAAIVTNVMLHFEALMCLIIILYENVAYRMKKRTYFPIYVHNASVFNMYTYYAFYMSNVPEMMFVT